MPKILFSLPVHERPDILRNQIENINYFCPGSTIIIHISAGSAFLTQEFKDNCQFENVHINPQSLQTIMHAGLMHTHASNVLHAIEVNIDFDYVVLSSSNELFVKHGLANYISRYEVGAQTEVYDAATDWHAFRRDILYDERMQNFLGELGLPVYFGGQAEGQFATKDLFLRTIKYYIQHFPFGPIGYPNEEIILPTVAGRYSMAGNNVGLPITLCNYCNNLTIDATVIEKIRNNTGSLVARRIPRTLRSPHVGASLLEGVFSVKRVPREDCELRRYITNLMN